MERPVLLIDGDCGFCRATSGALASRLNDGGPRDVEIRAAQDAELGVPVERTEREVVLVLPDGSAFGGAQAMAQWLIWHRGPLALAGRFLALPVVRSLAGLAYRAVAANRHRLPGGTAACAMR
ncbi:putative DCC family thiol-disulfide oxidoreductase YuxK [Naumannella cuiyingiana]|uniref:Putative DCC family thiol-disulfide oxidoreductase YuxK n=1 Tax=Naumannella cuiyingiana TaxID=1347891 RepID=A0A7Z0D6S9_9ACTN|nr:putative DCC family thiol-disulfide oxidoreductase YuxK [Naumannella cuiyingiana]